MKKKKKGLMGIIKNVFYYIIKIIIRIFKILVKSAVTCCPPILTLAIINTILGVNIRFSYYFILVLLLTLVCTAILMISKWEQIIAKPVRVSKKIVPAKTDKKTQRAIQRKRKKIS